MCICSVSLRLLAYLREFGIQKHLVHVKDVLIVLINIDPISSNERKRQKRYLIFTPATQFGVFGTISIPLPEPNNLVNVAWFYEANYFAVDNSTYFDPLLGVIQPSRSREKRNSKQTEMMTRRLIYQIIEGMLGKHGYHGRYCLLRSICDTATSHFSHNGLLGDLIHLILTPSTSMEEEDVEDCYYEAELYGLESSCGEYHKLCPKDPLDEISMYIDHLI